MKEFLHLLNKIVFIIIGFLSGFLIFEKYNNNFLLMIFAIIFVVIIFSIFFAFFDHLIDKYIKNF